MNPECIGCEMEECEPMVGAGTHCIGCFLRLNPELGAVILDGWRYRLRNGAPVGERIAR